MPIIYGGTLIVFLFIYPYYNSFLEQTKRNDAYWKQVIFFILGVLSGWTLENLVPSIILIICFLIIYLYKRRALSKWMLAGFIGFCLGYIILILAPGNYLRMQFEINTEMDTAFITIVRERIVGLLKKYLFYIFPLLLLYFAMYFMYRFNRNKEIQLNKKIIASIFFLFAAHISFFIMILSPSFPLRTMFSTVALIIIAIAIVYSEIEMDSIWKRILNIGFIIILISLYTFDVVNKYKPILLISNTFKLREIIIEEQKAKGIKDITLEGRIGFHEKYGFEDLSSDSTALINRAYAKFHGLHSIKVINKE
ncbi:MAG: DUF6056 family protein [Dysgonomonas sp.]